MVGRALAAAVIISMLGGCLRDSDGGEAGDADQPVGLHAICAADAILPEIGTGICTQVLAPTPLREREASIAAHPTDPNTILVTWRNGEFSEGPTIQAAFTTDAGALWAFTELRDPAVEEVPMETRYSWDSVARFGPDGTGYVLYGGERRYIPVGDVGRANLEASMTVASTRDGVTWSYHRFADLPTTAILPDAMDLAVAPDTGRLVVVAAVGSFSPVAAAGFGGVLLAEGVYSWTSDDQGATWSIPTLAASAEAAGAARPVHTAPRVVAGPDGLVLLTTKMVLAVADAVVDGDKLYGGVTISRDGGASWEEPRSMFDYGENDGIAVGDTELNSPAAVWKDGSGLHAALVYGDAGTVTGFRSDDAGVTWSEPVRLASYPEGMAHVFLRAEAKDGAVWASYRWGSDDPARFGASILRWTDAGVQNLTVADWPIQGAWKIGDDYGAVAVAADGTAWMAFSDGENGGERVRVAHVGD